MRLGHYGPHNSKSVHHFHRSWTIDTKIHDFVSFHIFQLPVMPFLTFFSKYLKNLGFEYLRGPGAFGENQPVKDDDGTLRLVKDRTLSE